MTRSRIPVGARRAGRAAARSVRGLGPVMGVGLALVAVQVAFRGWAVYGSWLQFDDFAFISRSLNSPLDAAFLFEGYGGHLMPLGLLLSWVFAETDPLNFSYQATTLVLMQAAASVGCLFLLRSWFGARWGILAPLSLYLFTALSVPAGIWWAAGVNQLPLQVALFWGLLLHVSYLRRPRTSALVGTAAVMVVALACYEKSLLLYLALAVVTLGYFASGPFGQRLGQVLRRYRPAVVVHVATGVLYLVLYALVAGDAGETSQERAPLLGLVGNLLLRSFVPGVVGGPLEWEPQNGAFQLVAAPELFVVAALVAVVAFLVHVDRTRERSRRAWFLPAGFLLADLLILALARAGSFGDMVALELRYITELGAVTALAVGLATMPLQGAVETVAPRVPSPLLDRYEWAALATVVVAALGLVSGYRFATTWQAEAPARDFFATVEADLADATSPVPLADGSVPQYILWGYRYPENATSHVLRMYDDRLHFPRLSVDRLFVVAQDGRLVPAAVPPVRASIPQTTGCAVRADRPGASLPLDGPAVGGWWVRLAYSADAETTLTIEAGDQTHRATLPEGLHNVYFTASGDFDAIGFSDEEEGVRVCALDAAVGVPQPWSQPWSEVGS